MHQVSRGSSLMSKVGHYFHRQVNRRSSQTVCPQTVWSRLLSFLLLLICAGQVAAALNLAVEVTPNNPRPGESILIRLTVSNPGAAQVDEVRLEMLYPIGLYSLANAGLSDSGVCTVVSSSSQCDSGETAIWNLESLAAGQGKTVYLSPSIRSDLAVGSPIAIDVDAFQFSNLQSSLSQALDIQNTNPLKLRVEPDHEPVSEGDVLNYDLIFSNQSGTATIANELRFPLPAGVVFIEADGNGSIEGNDVVWDLGLLIAGQGGRHRVSVQLQPGLLAGDIIEVNAQLTGEVDFIVQQTMQNASTRVENTTQLVFAIDVDAARPGYYATTHLTVSNKTDSVLMGVRVEMLYPSGVDSLSDNLLSDVSDCTVLTDASRCNSGETVVWTLGNLAPRSGRTLFIPPVPSTSNADGRLISINARVLSNSSSDRWERRVIRVESTRSLDLELIADHEPAAPGDQLEYELIYGNPSGTATSGTQLRFPLPLGSSFVSASSNGVQDGGDIVWELGLLNPGEGGRQWVNVQLEAGLIAGDIVEVDAASISGVANFVNQRTRQLVATRLENAPQLGFAIDMVATPVRPGFNAPMQLTATNRTAAVMTDVKIAMFYPNGMESLNDVLLSDGGDCSVLTDQSRCNSGETVFWTIDRLGPFTGKTVFFPPIPRTTNPDGRVITFHAKVSSDTTTERWERRAMRIAPTRSLNLEVLADHEPVAPGDELSYVLIYGHQNAVATSDSLLRFPLPKGTSFVSADGNGSFDGSDVVWNLGLLATREGGRARVTVRLDPELLAGDIVEVDSAEISGDSNFVTQRTFQQVATRVELAPQLSFSIDMETTPAILNHFRPMHLIVSNRTSVVMTAVQIELYYPQGLLSITDNLLSDGGDCTLLTDQSRCDALETVVWPIGTLPPGRGKTVSLPPAISTLAQSGRIITFYARASADSVSDRWDRRAMRLEPGRSFNLQVDIEQEAVLAGPDIVYELTFGNEGNQVVSNVELRFPIPSNTNFVSADGSGVLVDDEVVWNLGLFNPGDGSRRRVSLQLKAGVIAGDLLEVHAASIQAAPRIASWASTVSRVKDNSVLDLWLDLTPSVLMQGESFNADITLDNLSATTMTNVAVDLYYPHGLFNLSDANLSDGGDCTLRTDQSRCNDGETVFWNVASLLSSSSVLRDIQPIIRNDSGQPSDGSVIQFFAKTENDTSDRAFLTRSLLVGNFVPLPAPEIDLQGNALSIADGDNSPRSADGTDFGPANINGQLLSQSFSIVNSGDASLQLTGNPRVLLTGDASFSVSIQPIENIGAGGLSLVTIEFDPSSIGVKTATASISNSDEDEGAYSFQIQGTGDQPEIDILGNGQSIVNGDVTPSLADNSSFGVLNIIAMAREQSFTIQNTGGAVLNLTGIPLVSVAGDSAFSVVGQPSSSIAAGSQSVFTLRFDPSSAGLKLATISIANDDSDENPYSFQIEGLATMGPEMDVAGNGQSIASGDATPTIGDNTRFGIVNINSSVRNQSFSILNIGGEVLNLTGTPRVVVTGDSDFSVLTQPTGTVSMGGESVFTIAFDPSNIGISSATISISSDDQDENPYTFQIQGMGIDALFFDGFE